MEIIKLSQAEEIIETETINVFCAYYEKNYITVKKYPIVREDKSVFVYIYETIDGEYIVGNSPTLHKTLEKAKKSFIANYRNDLNLYVNPYIDVVIVG